VEIVNYTTNNLMDDENSSVNYRGDDMKRIELSPKDEFPHAPSSKTPLWREGYHFNGYDPLNHMGITASTGISPTAGMKNDLVTVRMQDVFLFLHQTPLEKEDVLQQSSLKIELLVPFKKWRVQMKDSFRRTNNGKYLDDSEEVEFDLHFESETPPCGYEVERFSTDRGKRYEQPGSLKGRIRIGDSTMDFEGSGIRDHSWEIRDSSQWEKWYGMMGWAESGEAVTFVNISRGAEIFCEGWRRTDTYQDVLNTRMDPISTDVLHERQIHIETFEEELEIRSQQISFVAIPEGENTTVIEALVELELGSNHGYGFLWHRRSE
jgi:hypothetical protein